MRIGLIARQDSGGLAAQSLEFAKNLPIAATFVVDLGEVGRGDTFPYDWHNPLYVKGPWIDELEKVRWFLDQVDVVLSIETFYGAMVTELASMRGIPTVRYVNPELYRDEGESHVVLPTHWEADRVQQATIIPQGVTIPEGINEMVRDRPLKTILHMSAPAMMDRNGTADFHASVNHCRSTFKIIVAGAQNLIYEENPKHEWIHDKEIRSDRLSRYTPEIDLLVLPRRFGGLCLPMLEAASYGIPTLTLDVSPQNLWPGTIRTEPIGYDLINMVGGKFSVYRSDYAALTEAMDAYADTSLKFKSEQSINWAKSNSWDIIAPMWMEYFEGIVK